MSGYTGADNYWAQSPQSQYFDSSGFGQPNQQFEFQTYSDQQSGDYSYTQKSYLDPTQSGFGGALYRQDNYTKGSTAFVDDEEEPPLLEELGIDPDRILQKTLAVLNPFHGRGQIDDANYLLQDSDLAGPAAFCLMLAAFLLLAGAKAHFNYVYGLSVISCIFMYILLSLMTNSSNITLSSVASILGYCVLPVVFLAGFNIFTTLRGTIGLAFAVFTVAWSTLSATRLLTTMSGDEEQRLLIAYPCALIYGVFALIIIF
ncbi:yip1 domain-containing 1 isoform X1 [Xylocopa sonorina]|uniref:yip1 domain-containing 1 isoform X1 n=1 Tax=Xylocopa sonorina TaxID=1818115 RepID=UPI00403ACDAD